MKATSYLQTLSIWRKRKYSTQCTTVLIVTSESSSSLEIEAENLIVYKGKRKFVKVSSVQSIELQKGGGRGGDE